MKKQSVSWWVGILCIALLLTACKSDSGTDSNGGNSGGDNGGINAGGGGGDQYGSGPDPVPDPTGNPSSYQLIDEAQTAGTITTEQALLYKMYVDFADSRLPAEYQGDETGYIEGDAPQQVMAYIASVGIDGVSAATLDILRPFFVPAYYEGSWWDQQNSIPIPANGVVAQGVAPLSSNPYCRAWNAPCSILDDWKSVGGTNVVVWYLTKNETTDLPKATMLVKEFDGTIWPKLTGLMGRAPLSDAGNPNLVSEADGRLDILLANMPADKEGLTLSSGLSDACKALPAHIYLRRTLSNQGLIANAAHEFMHAIQFSIGTKACVVDYYTILEATAVWATNFVYPDNNWEHRYPKYYLKNHWVSESYDYHPSSPSLFRYGAYLFPLFLQTRHGPSIVKGIWDNAVKFGQELYAIDGALVDVDSSFEKEWPKFAVANWNRHKIITYLDFDGIYDYADPNGEATITLNGAGSGFEGQNVSIPHASMSYYRVTFNDPAARSIAILNGINFDLTSQDLTGMGEAPAFTGLSSLDREGVSMQVYVKVAGTWLSQPTDLSNIMWNLSCRDDPAGNIDEIILIYANAEISPSAPNYDRLKAKHLTPGVLVSDIGCRDWTGQLSMTRDLIHGAETLTVSNATFTNLLPTYAPIPGDGPSLYPLDPADGPVAPGMGWEYALTSGSATWNYAYDDGTCKDTGQSTFNIANSFIPVLVLNSVATPGGSGDHGIDMTGGFTYNATRTVAGLSYNWVCDDGTGTPTHGTEIVGTNLDIQVDPTSSVVQITGGGLSVSGTQKEAKDSTDVKGTWSLNGKVQ